ncbi:MAG: translational GTPase TypA [Planctomycetota bacterium]
MKRRDDVRNLAIIAHVDHGKTTLMDGLIEACHVFRENQTMQECLLDSDDQERERGITIYAKNIALDWKGVKLNIVDTPGHADFGGEVERILGMVDGCLLLVDSFEGPMPQTRFVLQKAFRHGLKVMLVVNKVDRDNARPSEVLEEAFELFCDLDASDEALDFPVVYCSGRGRFTVDKPGGERKGLDVLLDRVVAELPGPLVTDDPAFRLQVSKIEYDRYLGRIAVGRVHSGKVESGDQIRILKPGKSPRPAQMKGLQVFAKLGRVPADHVGAGDICAIYGIPEIAIGETIADLDATEALPVVPIDEPTVSLVFSVNDGPYCGQSGEFLTSRHIKERLEREAISNVAMRIEDGPTAETTKVSGRGVMHLGVLIENMRREGYEFCVSRPQVIIKEIDGKKHEPIEQLVVNVPDSCAGKAMEAIGARRGELVDMKTRGNLQTLTYTIPARGLIGLRTRLMTVTSGEAVAYHNFRSWEPFKGELPMRPRGVMISIETDTAVAYALNGTKERGQLFVAPGDPVYEGMIVGEHCRAEDLGVNVSKRKQLTNMRASGSDENVQLAPPRRFSIEEALEYVADDELIEFTPAVIRLRKRYLRENDRKKMKRGGVKATV